MATVADVFLRARDLTNDASGTRWPNPEMFRWASDGLQAIFAESPSAFFVSSIVTTPPSAVTATTDTLPISDDHLSTLTDYLVARMLEVDDEVAENAGRSGKHLQRFATELK